MRLFAEVTKQWNDINDTAEHLSRLETQCIVGYAGVFKMDNECLHTI